MDWICFSGFLSENDNEVESWNSVLELFFESQIFVVKYKSYSGRKLILSNLYKMITHPFDFFSNHMDALLDEEKIKNVPIYQEYQNSHKNSKIAGKLIAFGIAKDYICPNQSINLI